jgi:flagellar biosynthesis protein FlhG
VGLALLGQRVVLADLDLGGADVHLYVGVKSLSKTWNDFLDKKVNTIGDILTTTPFEGLSLIGGDASRLGSGNLPYAQKRQIIQHLKSLECDFIIIDLGGDTSFNALDFFLLADQKIVVTGTEPASILDSYSFIKVVFHRFLERFLAGYDGLQDLRRRVGGGELGQPGGLTLESVFKETRERDPTAHINLKEQFEKFCLSIVVNMAEDRRDWRIAQSMQRIVKERCMVDVGILGTVPWDRAVRRAARAFTPIIIQDARNQSSQAIYRMLAAILLLREPKAIRSELLRKTNTIRSDTKSSIGAGAMTLDGLTSTQINAVYGKSRRTQHSFRKILSAMAGSQ